MDAFQWITVLLTAITVLLTAVSTFLQAVGAIKDKKNYAGKTKEIKK